MDPGLTRQNMTLGQYYKTFLSAIFGFFVIRVFVLGKLFQPSLMFVGKAGAYPSEGPFRCPTLSQAAGLAHKH
jgi:hypothetical protein